MYLEAPVNDLNRLGSSESRLGTDYKKSASKITVEK